MAVFQHHVFGVRHRDDHAEPCWTSRLQKAVAHPRAIVTHRPRHQVVTIAAGCHLSFCKEKKLNIFHDRTVVAGDMHVGDNDQNSILGFGAPSIAPGVFHMGILRRSSQMIFGGNISLDSVRYAVCADWKDHRNWAARLPAQDVEGEQKELVFPIQEGREQEERVAQTQEQIEEKTKDGRNCSQEVVLALVAQFAQPFGELEAFERDPAPFATFPSNGHYRPHCVRRAEGSHSCVANASPAL
jgi:hypothetical protein